MTSKENVLLLDCVEKEVATFAEEFRYQGEKFSTKEYVSNWKRTSKISELKRYAVYFFVGAKYFLLRKNYGVIVGWQQFFALIFCFFCSIFGVKKNNVVIALNYTYKEKSGKLKNIYKWFMSKCMDKRYLDYIHVPSSGYADIVSKEFDFPRDRIIVECFGVNDQYESLEKLDVPVGRTKNGYALAIGRSNRDYDFLIEAWKTIDFPLVIISDTYAGTTDDENITILRNVCGEESYPWIVNCGLLIIPIDDGTICSGDTVLLTAMSLKRKIVVTAPSTLAEMYIENGENALLTSKDLEEFRTVVNSALLYDSYLSLGEQARRSFLNRYSRKSMGRNITRFLAKGL